MYVYRQVGEEYQVGFYSPSSGEWICESVYTDKERAANRVAWLNGYKGISVCKNCKHFYQHYLKGGIEVSCGHCVHPAVKQRKPEAKACDSFEC